MLIKSHALLLQLSAEVSEHGNKDPLWGAAARNANVQCGRKTLHLPRPATHSDISGLEKQ